MTCLTVIVINSNVMSMIDYFTYSFNKHLLIIYHQSGNLKGAGETHTHRVSDEQDRNLCIY